MWPGRMDGTRVTVARQRRGRWGVGVVDLAGEAESDLGFVQLGKSSSG